MTCRNDYTDFHFKTFSTVLDGRLGSLWFWGNEKVNNQYGFPQIGAFEKIAITALCLRLIGLTHP
jgi:hypothetical protein